MTGWMRKKRAAKYADVSERTLSSWLKQGLPHSRAGGCLLIKAEALDAWLEAQSVAVDEVDRLASEAVRELGL